MKTTPHRHRHALLGVALAGASISALGACYGTEIPPQRSQDEPIPTAPPPTSDATKIEDKAGERKNASYDKTQTQVSVNRAIRQANECAKIHAEGPFGELPLTLIISSKGKIHDAQLPPPFDGTPIGVCVEKAFEHEMVPPWDGPDEKLDATVSLKKPAATAPPPPDPKGKKK